MRILRCEEVEKLAGLHNHFDGVHAHRLLLTELTVRNYCGNSFHREYIQAAVGHPERLRNWLIEPAEPFFSSSVADVALKARSLHEHKQERYLYKDISSPLRRQID